LRVGSLFLGRSHRALSHVLSPCNRCSRALTRRSSSSSRLGCRAGGGRVGSSASIPSARRTRRTSRLTLAGDRMSDGEPGIGIIRDSPQRLSQRTCKCLEPRATVGAVTPAARSSSSAASRHSLRVFTTASALCGAHSRRRRRRSRYETRHAFLRLLALWVCERHLTHASNAAGGCVKRLQRAPHYVDDTQCHPKACLGDLSAQGFARSRRARRPTRHVAAESLRPARGCGGVDVGGAACRARAALRGFDRSLSRCPFFFILTTRYLGPTVPNVVRTKILSYFLR
jgi:hypothetical protein